MAPASLHPALRITCAVETFPIAGSFVIARGAKTEARVVVATITDGVVIGRGECVPYARYGESVESVVASIEGVRTAVEQSPRRTHLQGLLPAGAARNALDCALWDLEAKRSGVPVWRSAGLARPAPAVTAFTISVGTPDVMAVAAQKAAARSLLKVKLGGAGDRERIAAVRAAAPDATLIVDANESWAEDDLAAMIACCAQHRVALIEQPLPAECRRRARQRAPPRADLRRRERARPPRPRRACAGATTPSTSSSTRPAVSPRRWPWSRARRRPASRS